MSRKTKAGVVGAITALAGLPAGAMAAPAPAVAPAQSYADLLQPIPNAVERLKLSNAEEAKLIRTRMQDDHHHHAQTKAKGAADHHHHAQTTAKGAADHHHHAQTTAKGAADHHHHAQTTGKGAAAHHHHAQTTKPTGA